MNSFIHSKKHLPNTAWHTFWFSNVSDRMMIGIFLGDLEENVGHKRLSWFRSYWIVAQFAFFLNAEVVFSPFLFGGKTNHGAAVKRVSTCLCSWQDLSVCENVQKCWVMPANVTGHQSLLCSSVNVSTSTIQSLGFYSPVSKPCF